MIFECEARKDRKCQCNHPCIQYGAYRQGIEDAIRVIEEYDGDSFEELSDIVKALEEYPQGDRSYDNGFNDGFRQASLEAHSLANKIVNVVKAWEKGV